MELMRCWEERLGVDVRSAGEERFAWLREP